MENNVKTSQPIIFGFVMIIAGLAGAWYFVAWWLMVIEIIGFFFILRTRWINQKTRTAIVAVYYFQPLLWIWLIPGVLWWQKAIATGLILIAVRKATRQEFAQANGKDEEDEEETPHSDL